MSDRETLAWVRRSLVSAYRARDLAAAKAAIKQVIYAISTRAVRKATEGTRGSGGRET